MAAAPGQQVDEKPARVLKRLQDLLVPGGALYLSWRVTEGADRRDEHGRLHAAFDPAQVPSALSSSEMLLHEQVGSVSSGKPIRRLIARKPIRA